MISSGLVRRSCVRFSHGQQFSSKASVSMSLIKELREASGAPIMDCKKALAAEGIDGDITKAFTWLRKQGMLKTTTMAGRAATEGLVGMKINNGVGVLVEVSSETDFVARNSMFQEFVHNVADTAYAHAHTCADDTISSEINVEDLLGKTIRGSKDAPLTVRDALADLVGAIRENIFIKRAVSIGKVTDSTMTSIGGYVHGSVAPGMGKSACICILDTHVPENIIKSLAMHCVAAKPKYLNRESVPAHVIEEEKSVLMEQLKEEKKPAHIIQKMVDGRMEKFYSELVLLEQSHMIEPGNPKIKKYLENLKTDAKKQKPVTCVGFALYSIGQS